MKKNTTALKKLSLGNLFQLDPNDAKNYGNPETDVSRSFMRIEHIEGRPNCVDIDGKYGPFIDPDRQVIPLE